MNPYKYYLLYADAQKKNFFLYLDLLNLNRWRCHLQIRSVASRSHRIQTGIPVGIAMLCSIELQHRCNFIIIYIILSEECVLLRMNRIVRLLHTVNQQRPIFFHQLQLLLILGLRGEVFVERN